MKDYDEVTGELEEQWNWRIDELVKLKNTYNSVDNCSKLVIRKTQILLLYSHFEGYVKFAFLYYLLQIVFLYFLLVEEYPSSFAHFL